MTSRALLAFVLCLAAMALGAWLGAAGGTVVLLCVALAGGVVALAYAVARLFTRSTLPVRWPEPFPFDTELAMRVATFAKQTGRAVAFSMYPVSLADLMRIGEPGLLRFRLARIGPGR